jgi:hypothetical protein
MHSLSHRGAHPAFRFAPQKIFRKLSHQDVARESAHFLVDKSRRKLILATCEESAGTLFPNNHKEIFMSKGLERKKETKKKPLKTPKEKKAEKTAKKGK